MVIVGSDRSCANGDIANKIGTYQIAVLAKEFGVPLYALTQPSNRIPKGEDIPIEVRDPEELSKSTGANIAPKGTQAFYPGFDVVPQALITEAIAIDVH
jgi:methylthioribose-1-phosphate isomerase